jgi:hypothetical protein
MAEPSPAPATDPPRGISMHQAAALLDSRQASGAYDPTRASAAPSGGTPSDQAPEPSDDETVAPTPGAPSETPRRPDAPAPDDEVDPGEEEAEDGEPEAEAEPEEETDEAFIEDEDGTKIPVAEALSTYKRFRDLQARVTRKEQALAEERRQITGQVREVETALAQKARAALESEQTYQSKIAELDTYLAEISQGLTGADEQWKTVDWAKLKTDAPAEYLLLRDEFQLHQDTKRGVETRRQTIAREQAEHEQRTQQQQYAKLQDHLRTRYADMLADPQKTQQVSDAMLGLARELGYSDHEISQTLDTRAWDLWHMAAQYKVMLQERDRAMQGQPKRQLVEGGELAPQRVKIVKPSAPKPRALTTEKAQLGGAYSAFQKDPSRENALKAMEARERYNGAARSR